MKKRLLTIIGSAFILLGGSAFIALNNAGKAGFVGSPGELTCSNCHLASTSVSGTSIVATPAFTGNQYVPGQTYTIQVGVGSLSLVNFGFACEILNGANTDAGVMQNPQAGVQFSVAPNGRKNATHSGKKAGTGFATFQFEWVAPNTGTVKIYAAGNAVNNNALSTGDAVSTASLSLSPAGVGIAENLKPIVSINIFPNPVKSDFKYSFSNMESGRIEASIFDIQGKEISKILSENLSAGQHTFSAEIPEGTAKGVYFLKFSHNGKFASQRLIMVQ